MKVYTAYQESYDEGPCMSDMSGTSLDILERLLREKYDEVELKRDITYPEPEYCIFKVKSPKAAFFYEGEYSIMMFDVVTE